MKTFFSENKHKQEKILGAEILSVCVENYIREHTFELEKQVRGAGLNDPEKIAKILENTKARVKEEALNKYRQELNKTEIHCGISSPHL